MFRLLLLISLCTLLVQCAPPRGRSPVTNQSSKPQVVTSQASEPRSVAAAESTEKTDGQASLQSSPQGTSSQEASPQPQGDMSELPQDSPIPNGQPGPYSGPQINWGQCPQLEPTADEKVKKAAVITKCLEVTPIPTNITRETVEIHREQVAACALQMEGWFNEQGSYRFDKAENEIKGKKLIKQVEESVLKYHKQCKEEAEEKYPLSSKQLIAQIQLYQACMDYFISEVCGIEVTLPDQYGPGSYE